MTLRFNDGGFTIVEKLFKALREILQHWRLSLASLLFYILLSLLTNVSRENFLVLAINITSTTQSTAKTYCLGTEPRCPLDTQLCYTLTNRTDAETICNIPVDCRTSSSLEFNLDNCAWRTRTNLVHLGNNNSDCLSMDSKEGCVSCLENLLDRDRGVKERYENYSSILRRYDCDRNYSMYGCADCKIVYKDWLCGISFDYYDEGRLLKPCLDFCYITSRKCPFLLPAVQYCGTQSYFCPKYRDLYENSTYAHKAPCFQCSYESGTNCSGVTTNQTDPTGTANSTKASITTLLIGQLAVLWIWRNLLDLPPGFA